MRVVYKGDPPEHKHDLVRTGHERKNQIAQCDGCGKFFRWALIYGEMPYWSYVPVYWWNFKAKKIIKDWHGRAEN